MIYENIIIAFVIAFVIQYLIFKKIKYSLINSLLFSSFIGLFESLNSKFTIIETLDNVDTKQPLIKHVEDIPVEKTIDQNLPEIQKTDMPVFKVEDKGLTEELPINDIPISPNPKQILDIQKLPLTKKDLDNKVKKEFVENKNTPIENKNDDDILKNFAIIDPKYWYEDNLQKEATCNMGCNIYPTYTNQTSSYLRIDKIS